MPVEGKFYTLLPGSPSSVICLLVLRPPPQMPPENPASLTPLGGTVLEMNWSSHKDVFCTVQNLKLQKLEGKW